MILVGIQAHTLIYEWFGEAPRWVFQTEGSGLESALSLRHEPPLKRNSSIFEPQRLNMSGIVAILDDLMAPYNHVQSHLADKPPGGLGLRAKVGSKGISSLYVIFSHSLLSPSPIRFRARAQGQGF